MFACAHKQNEQIKAQIKDDYSSFNRFENGVDSIKNWKLYNQYIDQAKNIDKKYNKITKELANGNFGIINYYGNKKIEELNYANVNFEDTRKLFPFRNIFFLDSNIIVLTSTNFNNPTDTTYLWNRKTIVLYRDSILAITPPKSVYSKNFFINPNTEYYKKMEKYLVQNIKYLKGIKDIDFNKNKL